MIRRLLNKWKSMPLYEKQYRLAQLFVIVNAALILIANIICMGIGNDYIC